jgi:hypothetical protein
MDLTINDPGNAELAIPSALRIGKCLTSMVSLIFPGKGPQGRATKIGLVAPGEDLSAPPAAVQRPAEAAGNPNFSGYADAGPTTTNTAAATGTTPAAEFTVNIKKIAVPVWRTFRA